MPLFHMFGIPTDNDQTVKLLMHELLQVQQKRGTIPLKDGKLKHNSILFLNNQLYKKEENALL